MILVSGTPTKKPQRKSDANLSGPVFIQSLDPVAREDKLMYGSLQHGEFKLTKAILLSLRVEGGAAVARWDEASLESRGKTLNEALRHLRTLIVDEARRGKNKAVAENVVPIKR